MISEIRRQFQVLFSNKPTIAFAPGRVNLIGEHTDYNEGFVLPGAVDKKIYAAIAPNNFNTLNVYAAQFKESKSYSLDHIYPVKGWSTYLLGMLHMMRQKRSFSGGVDVCIDGDIPVGAGMSSSAALCAAFGLALNAQYDLGFSRKELATLAQQTEHVFAGVQCGIMDQFASLHGKAGHVIKLDCRSLEFEYIPFHFPDFSVVLVNTMVSHSLASSEYNVRREQCEQAVSLLKPALPAIHSLRDVKPEELEEYSSLLPELVFRRAHYIVNENRRLLEGTVQLAKGDIEAFGKLMFEAHQGLRTEYEVSCVESDFLVDSAAAFDGCVGSRQMGGGFGGCTINLVRNESVIPFIEQLSASYETTFNRKPEAYITQIEEGAQLVAEDAG